MRLTRWRPIAFLVCFLSLLSAVLGLAPTSNAQTYVQSKAGLLGTGGNVTATFSAQPAAGNTVVVGLVCWASAGCTITSVTDNFSNSYTQIGTTAHYVGTNADVALYCASGISSGANFAVTAALSDSGGDSDLYIAEYSGLTCNVDQSATGSGSTSTTSLQTSSVTTTNPTDLLVAVAGSTLGGVATPGSGYTLRQNDNSGTSEYGGFEDQVVSATGSYSGSMTLASSTSGWGMAMAALKGSSSGGAAPTVISFTPTTGPVTTSVTITGTSFTGATAVKFNGTAATSFTVNSSTQIAATVPSGATTGPISVTTPSGTGTSTSNFTVTVPGPTIIRLSPPSGPSGISVTIVGSNLGTTGTVTFNGMAASPTSWSATAVIATVPSGATTGPVVVTVGSQTSNGLTFTATSSGSEPNITSLSTTSGPVGTSVTINGNGFGSLQGSGLVWLGTMPGNVSSWSATQIVATVASGAKTGNIRVLQNNALSNSVPFTVSGSCP